MSDIGERVSHDWSVSRLLDELWLRTRRVLVHELARADCWVDKTEYEEFLRQQRRLGGSLRDRLLPPALGPDDSRSLHTERAFRAANARVRAKLPIVLACGHELGGGLAALLPGASIHPRVASLCSLFNLGVSLFDVVVDQQPELVDVLARHVNEDTLAALGATLDAAERYRATWGDLEDDELRILLKLVAAFFSALHRLTAGSGAALAAAAVVPDLQRAYRAEISSAAARGGVDVDVRRVSQDKSTLPFVVMGRLACLGARPDAASDRRWAHDVALEVGRIFWAIDDLIDLADDLRSGSVNAVWASAGLTPAASRDGAQRYRAAMQCLSGRLIEQTAADLVARLGALDALLRRGAVDRDAIARYRSLVHAYVRCWIT